MPSSIAPPTLEDLAARLGMNPLDVVLLNLPLTGSLEKVYREELEIADRLHDAGLVHEPDPDRVGADRAGDLLRRLEGSSHAQVDQARGARTGHANRMDQRIILLGYRVC